jgi:hypothetical protein
MHGWSLLSRLFRIYLHRAKNSIRIKKLRIMNKDSKKIWFLDVSMRIVKILFTLYVWSNNGDLRRTTTISPHEIAK